MSTSDVQAAGLLPAPEPAQHPELAPYWEAAARGELLLPRCESCSTVIWYPRGLCPSCGGQQIGWFAASGLGTVYSYTVVTRGDGPYREVGRYIVAYVELAEGPRVLTNLVGADPDEVRVGLNVAAAFEMAESGAGLLRFRPVVS
jgi:uncharacterized OB-fold protein